MKWLVNMKLSFCNTVRSKRERDGRGRSISQNGRFAHHKRPNPQAVQLSGGGDRIYRELDVLSLRPRQEQMVLATSRRCGIAGKVAEFIARQEGIVFCNDSLELKVDSNTDMSVILDNLYTFWLRGAIN